MLKFLVKNIALPFLKLMVLLAWVDAQAQNKVIDLTTADLTVYDLSDGFSTQCFEKTFQDTSGLLWLKTCPYVGGQYNHHFTVFDGHSPSIPQLRGGRIPNGSTVQALDMTTDGRIYGIYSNKPQKDNGLFILNTSNRSMQIFKSSVTDGSRPIVNCQKDGSEMILLCADTSGVEVFRFDLQTEKAHLIVRKNHTASPTRKRSKRQTDPYMGRFVDASYVHFHEGIYWFLGGGIPLYKYDETLEELTEIDLSELDDSYTEYMESPFYHPYLVPESGGNFLLILSETENGALRYNSATDTFTKVPELFAMSTNRRAGSSKSGAPKRLMVFRYSTEKPYQYKSLLWHAHGQVDTIVLPKEAKYAFHVLRSEITGNLIISTDVGLFIAPYKDAKPAKGYLKTFATRGLIPVDDHRLLVSMNSRRIPTGIFDLRTDVLDNDYFESDFEGFESVKLMKREDGKIWIPDQETIGLVDVKSRQITEYPNPFDDLRRFDLKTDSILLVFHEGGLYSWEPEKDAKQLIYHNDELERITGHVNELLLAENGDVYCALNSGLLRINEGWKSHNHYGHEKDVDSFGVLSLSEDDKGRIWLGTYGRGIRVFDPKDESFQKIELADGLLNNTVASLEKDKTGSIWAGTFSGVSRIDATTLKVLKNLTQEDGLANNESNRFSSTQFGDGRIVIGSIDGFSVIDPNADNPDSFQKNRAKLSIHSAKWKDADSGEEVSYDPSSKRKITLSAASPSIQLDLTLSNFLNPLQHNFKYKIGKGDWQFLGPNRSLYLNELAIGDYTVQVRGIDELGRESRNTLEIPITVLPFFYQEWWFIALLAIPFLLLAAAWERRRRKTKLLRASEAQSQQLRELNELNTRFFTNLSHEFRTPLSVISGMTGNLVNHADESIKSSGRLIQKNSNLLLNLVTQILDLVKLEDGELKIEKVQANIVEFIHLICDGMRPLAESKSIDLRFESDANEIFMDFDQAKTHQILTNLLSNAIKFTPEGGSIEVSCREEGEQVVIAVADSGIGIPKEKLPLIFDRFYQVDSSSTREGEGTGIGLNLTKELVLAMDGKIEARSEPEEGTTVTVTLPITRKAKIIDLSATQVPSSLVLNQRTDMDEDRRESESTEDSNLPLILIIEDNPDITQMLKGMLSDSYRVETSRNGKLGVEKAIALIPEIVLSDVMMPEKDGIQVVDELKNNILTSHIPIILLTAKADLTSKLEGLERGADEYLSKPFHEEELLLRIKNLFRSQKRMHEWYQGGAPKEPSTLPEKKLEDKFIRDAEEVVRANLSNSDFGVTELYTEMAVSRTQLHEKIKALTGLSSTAYIRSVRIAEAKLLLSTTELTISEVAFKVGFSSSNYFSRTFTESLGSSPTEFRSRFWKKTN